MNAPLIRLIAALFLAPFGVTQQAPGRTVQLDVLALKNGDELVGKITSELDAYVEIQIEDGATIGVSRAMVKEVRRAARSELARAAVVRPDDAWFALHDADGASVGWLHASVTTRTDGSFAVNEEYEFVNGSRRYQITSRCVADATGRGLRCYYRERVSTPQLRRQLPMSDPIASADRIGDERIVEAVVAGAELKVSRMDARGRSRRSLPWGEDSTFPLLARTIARQGKRRLGPTPMFDPRHEELQTRVFDGAGARQLMIDGARQRVVELSESNGAGADLGRREWVDAACRVVRRELAGPALVAVPSSAASARASVGETTIQSAVVAEAEGRFGLWVPSPAWRSADSLPPGHLSLDCAVHGAQVRLSLLEHLDRDTGLQTAADAVGNWFGLLYPELEIGARFSVNVRGRQALRMTAGDAGRTQRATVDVIPHEGSFLVLLCRAPSAAWDELERDFAFVQRTLELDRDALNPRPTGPLSENRGGKLRPAAGPLPAPTPAPRVSSAGSRGKVRIPK